MMICDPEIKRYVKMVNSKIVKNCNGD